MQVKLLLNLGIPDAKACGIDPEKAKEGETVTVSEADGKKMIANGWAEPVPEGRGHEPKAGHEAAPAEPEKHKGKF
jgi:hypothetical protein